LIAKTQEEPQLDQWTIAALEDELTFCLSSAKSFSINDKTKVIHIVHKYYEQAEEIIYRINVWGPRPVFVINISDLTPRLRMELNKIKSTPQALNEVVICAIGRILESIHERYYHLSGIIGKIRWRFE
jgi:hypothetical protein